MDHTLQTLRDLRLPGRLAAFQERQTKRAATSLSFDERFALLFDREQLRLENRRAVRLLPETKLKSGVGLPRGCPPRRQAQAR